ncbi:MAG: hypothetical protein IKH76_02095 [Clostridiales bacterium]|nr:hypothetical protein [Clostridiales bacterium]
MDEVNVKLNRIKKSCHAGKIVSNILCIIAIVGCVAAIAGSVIIFGMGSKFDAEIMKAKENGIVTEDSEDIMTAKWFNIDLGNPTNAHSDIKAVQDLIDAHPYSTVFGAYLAVMAVVMAVVAVLMKMVNGVFALIETSDTPFTDKIIKRVTIVMIVSSAMLLMTNGAAFGGLGLIVTWAVRSILDYGKTLQIQSDETL